MSGVPKPEDLIASVEVAIEDEVLEIRKLRKKRDEINAGIRTARERIADLKRMLPRQPRKRKAPAE